LKHTRKHEKKERGIEPRSKAARHWRTVWQGGADGPHWPRGQSGQVPRTVRKSQQNHQKRTRKNGLSAPDPGRPLLKLEPSANRLQQKPNTKLDRKRRQERTRRTCEEHSTRGLSARHTRTVRASRTEARTARSRGSTPPTHNRISQTVQADETRVWGQDMHQTRILYPKKFRLLTP
jgi:hypothetical protein